MRDPERIDRILEKLGKIWKLVPDQRLGQILENYVFFRGERGDKTSVALFFQEDKDTEALLDKIIENNKEKIEKDGN
jgi:hypothetical protein